MIDYLRRKVHNLTHPVMGHILMLHRVVEQRSEKPEQRELEVTPMFLEQTIEYYHNQGYRFVSIDQVCDILAGRDKGKPFVCLTFDDGYQDNYTIALPILKRLDVPFAVYITTGFIDNRLPMWWYPGEQLGISTESLKALDADPLCTIGAHTLSHSRLDTLSAEEQKKEIVQSRLELETLLGHPIHHFSYPHGAKSAETVDIVHSLGFRSAVCAWGGTVRRGADALLLPRISPK